MKRNEIKEAAKQLNMDNLNNKRVETTRERVAHAIRLARKHDSEEWMKDLAEVKADIAHALNLLEAGIQELDWACEYWGWNSDICVLLDDACVCFGCAISKAMEDDPDKMLIACDVREGLVKLSKGLATLVRWFDDEADVSEV